MDKIKGRLLKVYCDVALICTTYGCEGEDFELLDIVVIKICYFLLYLNAHWVVNFFHVNSRDGKVCYERHPYCKREYYFKGSFVVNNRAALCCRPPPHYPLALV